MQRRQFLGSLTGPVVAACAVCLGACSKSSSGSTSTSNNGTSTTPANFTLDLSSQLLTIGSSVASNGVLIARLTSGNTASSFVAVQQACTHQGTSINFVSPSQGFLCPNHGAVFNTAGANTGGQSTTALKVYTVSVSGNTMTVSG